MRKNKGEQGTNNKSKKPIKDIQNNLSNLEKLFERIEQNLTNLEKLIRDIRKNLTNLEQQDQKGFNDNSEYEKELRKLLEKEQLDLMEEKYEIDLCEPYGKFFDDIHLPLQKLLGVEGKIERREETTQDYLNYLVREAFAESFLNALKNVKGEINKEGKFILTPKEDQSNVFNREAEKNKLADEELEAIKECISTYRSKVESGEIVLKKKEVVQGLGRMIEAFQDKSTHGNFPVDFQLIEKLSTIARTVLELNGIYPMFIEDAVEISSELKTSFSNPNTDSMPYPGFFIKKGEKWERWGNYTGMGKLEK